MSGSGCGEKKKSIAWQYFTILKDSDHKAKCNFCGKVISYKGGGPYNLIRHTKSQHPTVYIYIKETSSPAAPCSNLDSPILSAPTTATTSTLIASPAILLPANQPATQPVTASLSTATSQQTNAPAVNRLPKISEFLPKPLTAKKTENLNKILVKLFAKNFLPFSLVESPEFREFTRELNPNYTLPTRKTLSNVLLDNYYNITKEKVKTELAQAEKIALTTDGWSSDPNDNYVGLTAHFINQEAELKAYTLECAQYSDRHTAENLALKLRKICEEWEIEQKIVAVTTDNAKNIKAAVRINNWKQVSCFAHSLNLVVQNALPEIKLIHAKVKKIVDLFKRSPLACERLKTMQEKLGQSVLKVKQDVVTRWNSTCDMFERILQIKNSLLSTLAIDYPEIPTLTSDDLDVLQKTTELLRSFKNVTEDMSSERNVTISEMIFITNALKKKCLKFMGDVDDELPLSVCSLAHKLHDELEDRFSTLESDNVLLESTLLDPRLKKLGFHHESVCERALSNLNITAELIDCPESAPHPDFSVDVEPPPAKKAGCIWSDFDEQVVELAKKTSPTADVHKEIERFLEEPPLLRSQNPMKWWLTKKSKYPRLYSVASQRLCIPATSVPSERIFSKAGQIITERRNRLTGKKVNRLLFLNKNL